MDVLRKVGVVTASTFAIWLAAAIISAATQDSNIENMALILAFLSTVTFWLVLGLDQIGQRSEPKPAAFEKTKRGTIEDTASEDARLALLLALLSDEERAALKDRLINDLSTDGETLTLAQLLVEQERSRQSYR